MRGPSIRQREAEEREWRIYDNELVSANTDCIRVLRKVKKPHPEVRLRCSNRDYFVMDGTGGSGFWTSVIRREIMVRIGLAGITEFKVLETRSGA